MEKRLISTWLTPMPSSRGYFLASLTCLVMLLFSTWAWSGGENFHRSLAAHRDLIFQQSEWWRLFTALMVHSDLGHLLSNTFLFFVFGLLVAGYWSGWVFPVMTIVFGGLTNALVVLSSSREIYLMGASGMVYWLGAFWLTMYCLVNRQRSLGQRGLRVFGVALMLFMPTEAFNPQISYRAHSIGFALGLIFGLLYFFWNKRAIRAAEIYEIEGFPADSQPIENT